MLQHRLTDQQWELVEDLFPPPARTGRPRRDRREILYAIFWILRTGAPATCPGTSAPWATAWDLFDTWNDDGTLDAILSRLRAAGIDVGLADHELWCIDGTVILLPMCCWGRRGRRSRGARRSHPGAFPQGILDQDPRPVRRRWPPPGFPSTAGHMHEATGLVPLLEARGTGRLRRR